MTDQQEQRWEPLLESGCRTAVEFRAAWEALQKEYSDMSTYLEQDMEGEMAVKVEGAGGLSTDGSTRRRVTEQREKMRGAVLSKALSLHPNQQARPVLVWHQLDKLSSAWLLAYPGSHTGMSSTVFSEAVCSHLCLPSPV